MNVHLVSKKKNHWEDNCPNRFISLRLVLNVAKLLGIILLFDWIYLVLKFQKHRTTFPIFLFQSVKQALRGIGSSMRKKYCDLAYGTLTNKSRRQVIYQWISNNAISPKWSCSLLHKGIQNGMYCMEDSLCTALQIAFLTRETMWLSRERSQVPLP